MPSRTRVVFVYNGRAYHGRFAHDQALQYLLAGFGQARFDKFVVETQHLSKIRVLQEMVKLGVSGTLYFYRERRGLHPRESQFLALLRDFGVGRKQKAKPAGGEILAAAAQRLWGEAHKPVRGGRAPQKRRKPGDGVVVVPQVRIGIYK